MVVFSKWHYIPEVLCCLLERQLHVSGMSWGGFTRLGDSLAIKAHDYTSQLLIAMCNVEVDLKQ